MFDQTYNGEGNIKTHAEDAAAAQALHSRNALQTRHPGSFAERMRLSELRLMSQHWADVRYRLGRENYVVHCVFVLRSKNTEMLWLTQVLSHLQAGVMLNIENVRAPRKNSPDIRVQDPAFNTKKWIVSPSLYR